MLDRICPQCGMRTQEPTCPTHHCPTVVQVTGGLDSLPQGCVVGGRYRIERQIGKGGFGAVYLASHLATKQELVLKVLKPDLSEDPTQVQRFFNEARASSLLSHPNTVRVFDFGQTDVGLLYIAMERLHGKELAHALREGGGRLSALRAVRIAIGVLKSLAEAHHAGLVHRDLKPDNVFLCRVYGEDEFVKVIDFGIAKPKDSGEQNLTRTGFTVGTPKYMSPEQVLNKPLDGRSDLYALGVILYQCLAGEVPLVGASPMETLMAHLQQEPVDLRQRAPDVPVALAKLVMRALRKNPWERFTDADDMREALEPVLMSLEVADPVLRAKTSLRMAAMTAADLADAERAAAVASPESEAAHTGRAAVLRGVLVTTEREVPTSASQETAGPAAATAVLRTPAGKPVADRLSVAPEVVADEPAVSAAQNETTLLSTARQVAAPPLAAPEQRSGDSAPKTARAGSSGRKIAVAAALGVALLGTGMWWSQNEVGGEVTGKAVAAGAIEQSATRPSQAVDPVGSAAAPPPYAAEPVAPNRPHQPQESPADQAVVQLTGEAALDLQARLLGPLRRCSAGHAAPGAAALGWPAVAEVAPDGRLMAVSLQGPDGPAVATCLLEAAADLRLPAGALRQWQGRLQLPPVVPAAPEPVIAAKPAPDVPAVPPPKAPLANPQAGRSQLPGDSPKRAVKPRPTAKPAADGDEAL
jgi:hypothetical protein